MTEIWYNTDFVLFQDRYGEKVPLRCISVENIVWKEQFEARVVLKGFLPQAAYFLLWTDDIHLELLKSCHPDPCNYEAHELILRFYDGEVRRCWTPHFVPTGPEHQGMVEIYVSLDCKYKFFEGEGHHGEKTQIKESQRAHG